nr:hypothetical protein [uncultured Cohaesibacter sp.]
MKIWKTLFITPSGGDGINFAMPVPNCWWRLNLLYQLPKWLKLRNNKQSRLGIWCPLNHRLVNRLSPVDGNRTPYEQLPISWAMLVNGWLQPNLCASFGRDDDGDTKRKGSGSQRNSKRIARSNGQSHAGEDHFVGY